MSENRATKRLKNWDMEERSVFKRSRTQEEAEEDTDSPATKRRDLQPGPSSELLQLGLASSYSSGEASVNNNKFDVFISHRGPDTKCSLAYPIYFLLQERGVEAFLDREELQSGERFPEAIEKAIACSKVDLCILSSGFAESVWCLKELQMMLHKSEMCSSTLIPIFYDVEPAEVKYLKGVFGQGFEKLKSKNRNSSEDIEQWRLGLRKIGDICGYQGKGELSLTIVKRICEVLDIGCVDTPRNVIKREKELRSTIHDIMRCRNNGFGVTSVEISGIGGIGKTTFAKKLYNQIYTEYDRYCFIEDVNGLVEKHGVDEVHRQIFSKLFRDHERYLTEGKKLLKKRLHNAEILVVIDNIHSRIPLSTVFIENDVTLNPRSTIIVTSREEGVLKYDYGVKGYCQNLISLKMGKLDFDTSKKIFCHHAFGGIYNVNNEFNEMIEKIVAKCDGMPLALTLLGRRVYQKDIMFWKSLWSSMKDCLHGDVKKILKSSYDNLGSDLEKCLFLDIATFFCWEKEDLLLHIRKQSDDEDGELQVQYALRMLKSNLLINVSDGILGMHDVLVDLGKSIVKDENFCPGRRSRVWYPSDVRHMLSYELGTKKVKALTLVSEGSPMLDEGQRPWSADVFSELSSLEILILKGHCIEGDFSKLSKRLLWLRWTDFPYEEIPLKLCIKHLKVLQVTGENLIRLWEHPLQEAPSKLRELTFSHCIKLQRLPEMSGRLRHLSFIRLSGCKSLKFIPESFGQLQGLKDFRLWRCHALERLPESFGNLRGLNFLHMRGCTALKQLPESFGNLSSLISLDMHSCDAMVSLPESFGKLLQLERLNISSCNGLERLPQSFQGLTRLCTVHVSRCRKIKFSPEQFQRLQPGGRVEWYLSPDLYHSMKVACSWFAQIGNTEFWKNYSKWHSQVPQQHNLIWLLRELAQDIQMGIKKCLDSNNNNNDTVASQASVIELAIHFIESAGNMTFPCKASQLTLQGLWNLRELPQLVGNNRSMERLHLFECYSLQKLPDNLGNFPYLKSLLLVWCCNLQELPDAIGNLRYLIYLKVEGCLVLKGLPSSLQNLSDLTWLHVQGCWMVEAIHVQGLLNLTELTVCGCVKLKSIVGLSDLRELKSLKIKGCMNLRSIVGLSDTRELESLEIKGCMNLKSIVGLSNICKLKKVVIGGCISLGHMLPTGGFASFNSLSPHLITVLSEDFMERHSSDCGWNNRELHAKTSPLCFATAKERVRHLLLSRSSSDKPSSFYIHELAGHTHTHVPSLPFTANAIVTCAVSGVYIDAFPDHSPLPETTFSARANEFHVEVTIGKCFDLGEEIHVATPYPPSSSLPKALLRGDLDWCVNVKKDKLHGDSDYYDYYPSYEASVKEGCIIFLNGGGIRQSELLTSKISEIFCSEVINQRLMSQAWTQLPSQLWIHDFAALDIAGCQITKISRHCNTCIMEEETGLTWKRRRCIFMDDHSLLLQQPKNSKHSFLAYPGVDCDLEAAVANLYEMSISILAKGEVVHSRKLQQISPKVEEEIPSPLNSLLQSRGFHSTLETMHRLGRFMSTKLEYKYTHIEWNIGLTPLWETL